MSLLLKTSLRNIYYRIEKSGYSSYKELVGVVKGIYIEKQRSDTSIASINCLNYIKEILKEEYESEVIFEGLFNCWFIGLLVYWFIGLLVCTIR